MDGRGSPLDASLPDAACSEISTLVLQAGYDLAELATTRPLAGCWLRFWHAEGSGFFLLPRSS